MCLRRVVVFVNVVLQTSQIILDFFFFFVLGFFGFREWSLAWCIAWCFSRLLECLKVFEQNWQLIEVSEWARELCRWRFHKVLHNFLQVKHWKFFTVLSMLNLCVSRTRSDFRTSLPLFTVLFPPWSFNSISVLIFLSLSIAYWFCCLLRAKYLRKFFWIRRTHFLLYMMRRFKRTMQDTADNVFLQRISVNHLRKLIAIAFEFSELDFIIRSNSTNFPGGKNTFVTPNL